MLGVIFAILSSIFFAMVTILIRKLAHKKIHTCVLNLYTNMTGVIMPAVLLILLGYSNF